jgi:hypothetical protein
MCLFQIKIPQHDINHSCGVGSVPVAISGSAGGAPTGAVAPFWSFRKLIFLLGVERSP